MTREIFKKMVFANVHKLMPIYIKHLFDSDFLLRITHKKGRFFTSLIDKNYGADIIWDKEKFTFSRNTVDEWYSNNTVYYNGCTIGCFQVHHTRNCFEYRFHYDNLIKIIEEYKKSYNIE